MIHVTVTGPRKDGKFPYTIEGQAVNHGRPILGREAEHPLFDACVLLAEAGEPADHLIGLFDSERFTTIPGWAMRTTIGYGSRWQRKAAVRYSDRGAVSGGGEGEDAPAGSLDAGVPTEDDMADYREFPGGPIKSVGDRTHPDVAAVLNAPPAKSAAPPPPPSTPQEPPADTGPVAATPAKSKKSHRPRKAKGSGGRRAGSRGR